MLGDLSKKYESSGDPGSVSTGQGDAGGISYGAYQFSSSAGTVANFVGWLNGVNPLFYELLDEWEINSDQFIGQWKYIAENYPDSFLQCQHNYTKELYYDRAVEELKRIGIDIENRSDTLKDVVWSRSVQYHPKWMCDLFEQAADVYGDEAKYMSDYDLIYNIYEVLLTDDEWTSGSPTLRYGLFKRFTNERIDALNMLERELNG